MSPETYRGKGVKACETGAFVPNW